MSERLDESPEALKIHRILVAVDASPDSRVALRAAVRLASRFQAELEGLFVEDLNVLRAAQIPYAQELGHYTGDRRFINPLSVERSIRSRVRRMRRLFQLLTEEESVNGSFHVARGMVQSEIRNAAAGADVLIIGRTGWARASGKECGALVEDACSDDAPRVTAIFPDGSSLRSPVVVVYDGSDAGNKALQVGASIVDEVSGPLQILLHPVVEDSIASLRARANACLRSTPVMRQYRMLASHRLPWFVHVLKDVAAGTLVLPGDAEIVRERRMPDLLAQIDIPVLLVR